MKPLMIQVLQYRPQIYVKTSLNKIAASPKIANAK